MKDILSKPVNQHSPMVKAKRLMELLALVKSVKPEIDELKADLLKVTQDLGVLTLKTEGYTISRAKRVTPEVTSFKLLKASLVENNIPFETEETFTKQMDVLFKKLIEDKRELDGLEGKETEYISVRVKEVENEK